MGEPSAWITTSTVLQRLVDAGDRDAWSSFVDRFRGLIVGYARRRGLSHPDAEDAAQEALSAFAAAYSAGRYNREKGRLSNWLYGFASNKVRRALERARTDGREEVEAWSAVAGGDVLDPEWEEQWEKSVFESCLTAARGEFRGSTWRVFELLVLEERSVEQVVSELGLSRNAVYIAKHRVLTRLEELVRDCDTFDDPQTGAKLSDEADPAPRGSKDEVQEDKAPKDGRPSPEGTA